MKTSNQAIKGRTIGRSLAMAILLFLSSLMGANAQVFEWARHGGGWGWRHANAIAVDDDGNSFVAGEFSGEIEFTNGANESYTAYGTADAFIAMYDAAGVRQWVYRLGQSSMNITAQAIAISGNSLYVTGEVGSPLAGATFSFGGNTPELIPPGSSFVARYDLNTNTLNPLTLAWAKVMSQPGNDPSASIRSKGIAVGPHRDIVYVCGSYRGPGAFNISPNPLQPAQSLSAPSLFLAKFQAHGGAPTWIQSGTSSSGAYGSAVAVAANNDAVVTGHFIDAIDFSTGTGSLQLQGNTNGRMLVARYNQSGTLLSAQEHIVQSDSSFGRSVAIDASGNVYVAGGFTGTLSFFNANVPTITTDAAIGDFFIVKYGPGGDVLWADQGHTGLTGHATCNGITVRNILGQPAIFITGTFSGAMELGTVALGSMGNHDIFVARYNGNGNMEWARRAGNIYSSPYRNHYDQGVGIGADEDGNSYITGEFGGEAGFFEIFPLVFPNVRNIFTARLSANAVAITGTVSDNNNQALPDRIIEVASGANNISDYVTTGSTGIYTAYVKPGTYTLTPVHDLTHWNWAPASRPVTVSTSQTLPVENQDFTFTPNGSVRDLRIQMHPVTTEYVVDGDEVRYLITYQNVGTMEVQGVTITLNNDPRLQFDPSRTVTSGPALTYDAANATATQQSWTLPALAPLHGGAIIATFSFRDIGRDDRYIRSSASISKLGDIYPTDNTGFVDQEVFQPSDPNNKPVLPDGEIGVAAVRNYQELIYTINFFNLGPGIAQHVIIKDTLDSRLLASSFTLMNAAPGIVTATHDAINPSIITLTFENANLVGQPQSESGCRGFATFKVRVKTSATDVPVGSLIPNRACVVFVSQTNDTTHPLCTPTAMNCVAPDFTFANTCFGDSVSFTTILPNGIEYLTDGISSGSWYWDFGDGSRAGGANTTHKYTAPGTYVVTLRFRNTSGFIQRICGQMDSVFMVRKVVVISPPPQPVITSHGNVLESTLGSSYQWYVDSGLIRGATAQRHQPAHSGIYTVQVTNATGCEGLSNSINYPQPGVAETPSTHRKEWRAGIHPNPGSGTFTIVLDHEPGREWKVTITDMYGRSVLDRQVGREGNTCQIDLAGHPSGVYVARIECDGEVIARQFVLRR